MKNNMTVAAYQIAAGNTDHITPEQFKQNYYQLGGCGESSELIEKLLIMYEGTVEATPERIVEVIKECGDSAWYCVRYMKALQGIATPIVDELDTIHTNEDGVRLDINKAFIDGVKATILMGKCSDIIKKVVRDNCGRLTIETIDNIIFLLMETMKNLANCSRHLGYYFSEACEMNIAKLASRERRNVIHGSGDNR